MKRFLRYTIISVIFSIALLFFMITSVNALTIIETTKVDEYDTIANNSIIIGATKFEPNEILTAGKSSLATYNDVKLNMNNNYYSAPQIYYYLQGSWFKIDNDNNATVVDDEKLIEDLNTQDIYYVNNNEKMLETESVGHAVEAGYELIFESNDVSKNAEIRYEGKKIFIPATLNSVKVISKTIDTGKEIEIETLTKETQNNTIFKSVRTEKTGEDAQFKYVAVGNGKIQISRYIGSATEVVIPAEYDEYKVYSVGNIDAGTESTKRYHIFGATNSTSNKTIKKLTISEGIEVIETAAFAKCSGITGEFKLPSSLRMIGYASFDRCKGYTGDLVIPEGVQVIGNTAFQQCTGFKGELKLPSTLIKIDDYAFNYCSTLIGDIDIPEGVTYIGESAFNKCTGFNGILTLPSTLVEIGDFAFNHCEKLTNTSVEIPKNVIRIGRNKTEGTHIFYDFANKTLTEFKVEEGNTAFQAIDGVLYNIEATRLIAYPSSRQGNTYEIPEGVTIIDELAFSRAGLYANEPEKCLKKIVLPNSYILKTELPSNYLNKGNNLAVGIYNNTGIEEVEIKKDNPNYKSENGIVYSKDGTILWYVPLKNTGDIVIAEGVTTIKGGAFFCGSSSDRLHSSVTIPASVTEIDDTALAELKIIKSKVTFAEGCVYQFNASGAIEKK